MREGIEITLSLIRYLVKEQFPAWSSLEITPVEKCGNDNRTFRLGNEMLVRVPSAPGYAPQVLKEQEWLPKIAPHLPLEVPKPIGLGTPCEHFPWHWSIYEWIEGKSLNELPTGVVDPASIARDLADFLSSLYRLDASQGPEGGLHNYFRGCHPSAYDEQARDLIYALDGTIDVDNALLCWERALATRWEKEGVWVHGDVAIGNVLIREGKLAAVIDFGCMGVGDPACDLVIAWTYFTKSAREQFMSRMKMDTDTWDRARGWALWKAAFECSQLSDINSLEGDKQLTIIKNVLS